MVRSKEQELDQSSRRKSRPRIRTNLFCHPEALLFRIWAWVSAKDGSMIWDEGLRTTLHSVQRLFFFASCAAASLPRTFLRASLPRASEHHFLAKPALRLAEGRLASTMFFGALSLAMMFFPKNYRPLTAKGFLSVLSKRPAVLCTAKPD
ncbi:hypothetical protein RJ60_08880 [Mesotoga sp. B105.6.4]|nr:hypothetical protein RJ60_08880 [Mesotoga sp. B105.6.4]